MSYYVLWHGKAQKDLVALDRKMATKIIKKITEYLAKDPIGLGKPLTGIFLGLYRYRLGNYRVIYAVERASVTIKILRVGHRKEVYKK